MATIAASALQRKDSDVSDTGSFVWTPPSPTLGARGQPEKAAAIRSSDDSKMSSAEADADGKVPLSHDGSADAS